MKWRPNYDRVKDWLIIDERTINDYTEDANPIRIVNVKIGSITYLNTDSFNGYTTKDYPITRWMTRNQFDNYHRHNDIIIW